MKHEKYSWKSIDDLKIFAQMWYPEGMPKGVIHLIHGHGEHSSRYHEWARLFVQESYAVISFDQRGHGKSEGKRGHAPSLERIFEDVDLLFSESSKLFPTVSRILYGHSMGGNIAINYAMRNRLDISALVVTSPWLRLATEPPQIKVVLAKIMQNIFPTYTDSSKLNAKYISHDKREVEKYITDELIHNRISVSLFSAMYSAGYNAIENANKLTTPLLLMHGSNDKITAHEASIEFAEIARRVTTLKIWDNLSHEIHNENSRGDIFKYTVDWLSNEMKT